MTDASTPPHATFRVSAEVVARLGEELITDRTQALLELVKNSYDAGADHVELTVDSTRVNWLEARPRDGDDGDRQQSDAYANDDPDDNGDGKERLKTPLTGAIEIADTGHGLDEDAITQGWLTLSASPKRAEKRSGRASRTGRIPLGDKGLGRLGAQRLGDRLSLRTRPRAHNEDDDLTEKPVGVEHRVVFRFSDFTADKTLDGVPIERTTDAIADVRDPWKLSAPWGTVISIEGLNDPQEWNVNQLAGQLSRVLNPFKRIPGFRLTATVDGYPVELIRVTKPLRDAAMNTWSIDYADGRLTVHGSIRRQWFRPSKSADRDRLDALLAGADGIDRLLAAMASEAGAGAFTISKGRKPWLVELHREIEFGDVELPGRDPNTGLPVDSGPFHAELDNLSLNLKQAIEGTPATFNNQADYRALVRDFSGVSVYRDGFAVASGFDLLRLGETFTAGRSFYALRPGNTMGFVELTVAANAQLEETTDREGFRRTPAFERFEGLLGSVRDEINMALEIAGRGSGKLLKADVRARAGVDEGGPSATESAEQLGQRATALADTVATASRVLTTSIPADDTNAEAAVGTLRDAASTLEDIGRLGPLAQTLRDEIEGLTVQLDEAYETVGVGIVAESLAHEMTQILDRLAAATADIRKRLGDDGPASKTCSLYVEQVGDAIRALRTQLRHLDPQLRYARAKPRVFALGDLVLDVMAYHADRLKEHTDVDVDVTEDAQLRGMPGRLAQVLDNLALNSEYWVSHAIEQGSALRGQIDVLVDGPLLRFTDNGVGVRPDLRGTIFDAFVSSRRDGRGLGLYVCRQLLDREGATIALAEPQPAEGTDMRIDLTAMLATMPKD